MKPLAVALVLCLVGTVAGAQTSFGEFEGAPSGELLDGPTGKLFRLSRDFVYRDPSGLVWTAPAGEVVDGASIPKPFRVLVGYPFSGKYLNAAIIHDYYCCAKNREYHTTHHAFWLGMRAAGVEQDVADTMWAAVRMFGPDIWSVDPAGSPPVPCRSDPREFAGVYEQSSPETKAKAVAKFTAIARTLNTTRGRVLDVVDGALLAPRTPEAEAHLEFLNKAIASGFDVPPEKIGLISGITQAEIEAARSPDWAISPWVKGQIPEIDAFMSEQSLRYPMPRFVEGQIFAPYVSNGLAGYQVKNFPVEFLTNGTLDKRI
ncbi:DUF1353 domain-containing protein [Aminobacter carboxidus]|uniref:DUF1353 domain-containing protein n=1 Tax=Aminobacter carboxidus TaxID=376165 RepID=A0ABR9GVJ3_9HYPH|nr:DUF1353 domain-containing protein [Aminobacter carboxidus]MBE1207695.1 DUF1353 domain-containing protein [Aminobacter carboxidus]